MGARLRARLRQDHRCRLRPSQTSAGTTAVAFYSGHLCERGTDTALYDYADCAETQLHMCSYVLYDIASPDNFHGCIERFSARFHDRLIGVRNFDEVDGILAREGIKLLYLIKIVDDRRVLSQLPGVRNMVHAVFFANAPHGDVYARISPCVPRGTNKNPQAHNHEVPVVPHIVRPGNAVGADLRSELGIPPDALVFGRHGGYETFDIPFVHEVVVQLARTRADIHFVLVNTAGFSDPLPNIHHLRKTSDPDRKAAFIRSCDAMLHARQV